MSILLIEYHAADVAGWLEMFDRNPMNREAHGVTRHWIYRDVDDGATLMLALEFPTAGAAADFRQALQPVWDMSGARRAWVLEEARSVTAEHRPAQPGPGGSSFFMYKLIPPRPTFATDLSPSEAAIMAEHAGYWTEETTAGRALFFGPVADPAGAWGFAIVRADDEDEVRAMGQEDPAVTSGLATYEVFALPGATGRM